MLLVKAANPALATVPGCFHPHPMVYTSAYEGSSHSPLPKKPDSVVRRVMKPVRMRCGPRLRCLLHGSILYKR